jgi:glutaredoxin
MSHQQTITIFSQPGCPTCMQVKSYLSGRSLTYIERDITQDEAAMAELYERGYSATPLTLIGEVEVLGFNRTKLESVLGKRPAAEVLS